MTDEMNHKLSYALDRDTNTLCGTRARAFVDLPVTCPACRTRMIVDAEGARNMTEAELLASARTADCRNAKAPPECWTPGAVRVNGELYVPRGPVFIWARRLVVWLGFSLLAMLVIGALLKSM